MTSYFRGCTGGTYLEMGALDGVKLANTFSLAKEFGWKLNNGPIAYLWRGGCIIRSRFLEDIKKAFDKNPTLENLLLDDFFRSAVIAAQPAWRRAVTTAVQLGLPVPAFAAGAGAGHEDTGGR